MEKILIIAQKALDEGKISANDFHMLANKAKEEQKRLSKFKEGFFDVNKSFSKPIIKRNF